MNRPAAVALLAVLASSCAAPLMKLPDGPGTPASDATEILDQALATCRGVKTVSAELSMTGSAGGRRTRARLLVGLAAPDVAYIEAPAPFGAPMFLFAARDDEATLLLPRDRRALEHGKPAEVLEALAGVPLTPSGLRATLTGCATTTGSAGTRLSDDWRVIPGEHQLYLRRDGAAGPWRLAAVIHRSPGEQPWRAEYSGFQGNLPRAIRLVSSDASRFDLRVTLTQMDINLPLEAEALRVQVPAGTDPLTIEQLRQAGPLADRSGDKP